MPESAVFLSAAMQPCRMLALFALLACFAGPATAAVQPHPSDPYGQLPLHFEKNQGQAHKDVRFLARGSGYSLYLTAGEAVLVLATPNPNPGPDKSGTQTPPQTQLPTLPLAIGMRLVDAASAPQVSGLEELPGKANYLIGKDPAKWRTNVPTYAKVRYREVYPGIDLIYYGKQRQLEHDFVVSAGADAKRIVLSFDGADKLEIDAQGDLVLRQAGGDIRQHKPIIYQEIDGIRHEIDGGYVLKGDKSVGFHVAAYDTSRTLIIDPVLAYSTFLGGSSSDSGGGIAVDPAGNAYVVGGTASLDFPTTAQAFQATFGGGINGVVFVTKLNPTGTALVYSTYLGGSGGDGGFGIAVDAAGNAYVTGGTRSTDFPTTASAFQTTIHGGNDAFVTKLNPTGSALVYSTFLGGDGNADSDWGQGIAVDSTGNAYVTGTTYSRNFPTTATAFQPAFPGGSRFYAYNAFVTKLNPAGTRLVYSTFLGGSNDRDGGDVGVGIAVNAAGNAYVTGRTSSLNFPTTAGAFQPALRIGIPTDIPTDAFVTKFNPTGSAPVYSTFLGGDYDDYGRGIALDIAGNAYVAGVTGSLDFPTTAGAYKASFDGGTTKTFVTKLNSTGSALIYSTYLGGQSGAEPSGIAVDAAGKVSVTGLTYLSCRRFSCFSDFPTTPGAFQPGFGGGFSDLFVTTIDAAGSSLVYSTCLGGSGGDQGGAIAVDAAGNVYVTGHTKSADFPTTPGVFQPGFGGGDAFVAKFDTSDGARPHTAAKAIPPPNAAGWNKGPVIVMLSALDNKGGSGVASITYSINGGAPVSVSGATAAVTLSAEKVNTLAYYATDKIGNAESSKTRTVRIDPTAPTGTVTLSRNTLWQPDHRLVTIKRSISATDNLSGPVKVSAPVVTSNEPKRGLGQGDRAPDWVVSGNTLRLRAERADDGAGRIYTVTYTFTDQAGNSSQASATVTVPLNR